MTSSHDAGSLSRRRFLAGGLGVGLGVGLAGGGFPGLRFPAHGCEAASANDKIRLGFIGVGNQGGNNLRKLMRMASADVTAVCEVDQKRLAAAAKTVNVFTGRAPREYADFRKLLDDKSVDAVVITTPDHWHALPTVLACQAGKDVYVEKPLSLTVTEGRLMVQAARKYKRIVQTGSQQRSDAKFHQACTLVRNGALGKIQEVTVGLPGVNFKGPVAPDSPHPPELDYDFWLGPAPARPYNPRRVHYDFRFFWDYSGGQLTNWGAHHLDIVQWALGADDSGPVSVEASADFHPKHWYEVPVTSMITYTYPKGIKVLCKQGQPNVPNGVTFRGDRGTLHVDRGVLRADPPEILTEAPSPSQNKSPVVLTKSADHAQNWIDCIRSRKSPICDVEIGHRSATVCHLGNIAIRTAVNAHSGDGYRNVGQLEWDPEKEIILSSVGKPKAETLLSRTQRAPWILPDSRNL